MRLVLFLLIFGALVAVFSVYPYVVTALEFRQRDNGLAYILLVLGVGVWNGMFVAQLLSQRPVIKGFFLGLSVVGSLLAGLGWFLFCGTASSTPRIPNPRVVFGAVAVLIGIDIVLGVMAPIHEFYWVLLPEPTPFTSIEPRLGYWLHTLLLVALFGSGTVMFAAAWRAGTSVRYARAYTVFGTAVVVAIAGSNVLAPGGYTVAPPLAIGLTTVGWLQAQRGWLFDFLRSRDR